MPEIPLTRDAVLDAVAGLMTQRFGVVAERDKRFGDLTVDLYLPPPLHCVVQFDDATHCTRERARDLAAYPPDMPLNFDVRRYLADQNPGHPAVAATDREIDFLPGLNPVVRIREDELAEEPGTLAGRVAAVLARRFACHAGTTFHLMLENAGAKPHRPVNLPAGETS